jgi:hypothetical protein
LTIDQSNRAKKKTALDLEAKEKKKEEEEKRQKKLFSLL